MQLELRLVEEWLLRHNLLLSCSKTGAFLLHCNSKQLTHPLPHLMVGAVKIDETSTFCWLGVDFDSCLTMLVITAFDFMYGVGPTRVASAKKIALYK